MIDEDEIERKLNNYILIDEIYQLKLGKYIRWISQNGKLTNGAILIDIKFTDNGTHILCKAQRGNIIELLFDNCVIFQKKGITDEFNQFVNL